MMAKAIIPVLKDFKQQINNTNDRLIRQHWMMTNNNNNNLFTFSIHEYTIHAEIRYRNVDI